MATESKKIERKYLAHFIDASFGGASPNYIRLGADLEEYNEELNPDVEIKKNILGEQNVQHSGYEVQSEVEPFYAYTGDALFERLAKIANERLTGSDCITTKVDVLLDETGKVLKLAEKPQEPESTTGIYALYLYKQETLPLFAEYLAGGNNPDSPGRFPEWLIRQGHDMGAYLFTGECIDIGTHESYQEICEKYAK